MNNLIFVTRNLAFGDAVLLIIVIAFLLFILGIIYLRCREQDIENENLKILLRLREDSYKNITNKLDKIIDENKGKDCK